MAKINEPGHRTLLDAHSAVYPTGVATDYSFSGLSATLSFEYTTEGSANDLLMLTWPHHR